MSTSERIAGGPLGTAIKQRVQGDRPRPVRALAGATIAGAATGIVVYRLLRQ